MIWIKIKSTIQFKQKQSEKEKEEEKKGTKIELIFIPWWWILKLQYKMLEIFNPLD